MKLSLLFAFILMYAPSFGQSQPEKEMLQLSRQIFNWETHNRFDSLERIFDERFLVVGGSGEAQTKQEYLKRLTDGDFVHHDIEIERDSAVVVNNTAMVFGQGKFTVTASGKDLILNLSYMEVFTRVNPHRNWNLLAMHAGVLTH